MINILAILILLHLFNFSLHYTSFSPPGPKTKLRPARCVTAMLVKIVQLNVYNIYLQQAGLKPYFSDITSKVVTVFKIISQASIQHSCSHFSFCHIVALVFFTLFQNNL